MQSIFRQCCAAQIILGCFLFYAPIFSVYAAAPVEPTDESPLDVGITAVDDKDFAKAFTVFQELANAGNAEAQHNLAMLYRTGNGVEKDLNASFEWFQKAADQGVPDAQYYLAYMYDNGEAIEKDPKQAFEWYRKAAKQGQGMAQINLGVIYANGVDVPQNITEAYLWFHAAAAQGYKVAFENRLAIETALKEQGETGKARLDLLKKQARGYFQMYVQPFSPAASPRSNRLKPPPAH